MILPADRKCTNNVVAAARTTARGTSTGIVYSFPAFSHRVPIVARVPCRLPVLCVASSTEYTVSLTRTVVGKSSSLKRKTSNGPCARGRAGGSPVTQIVRRPDTSGSPEGRGGLRTRGGKKIPICAPHVRRHTCDDRESQYMCTLLIIRQTYVFTIRMCVCTRPPTRTEDRRLKSGRHRNPFDPYAMISCRCRRHGRPSSDNGKSCVRVYCGYVVRRVFFFHTERNRSVDATERKTTRDNRARWDSGEPTFSRGITRGVTSTYRKTRRFWRRLCSARRYTHARCYVVAAGRRE